MSHFAVVQEKLEKIDAPAVADILVQHGGMLRVDAMQMARREQGILGERFEKQAAINVAGALTRSGIAARAVSARMLPKLPVARTVRWVQFTEEELVIPDGIGREEVRAAWPAVFVISAGRVKEQVERKVSTPRGLQPGTHEVIYEVESITETKVSHAVHVIGFTNGGELFNISLPADELSYGRILETPSGTSFQRYLTTIEQLIARSTTAFVSTRTRMLLVTRKEHSPNASGTTEILDSTTFHKYNRWMLTLVLFKEQARQAEG